MNNYKEVIEKVLVDEGGYVKDPIDRGGETYRGISRRFFPRWEGWSIVEIDHFDDRLDDMVVDFYRKYFWDAIRLGEIEDDFVASMLMNAAVLTGKRTVVKKWQKIVGVSVDGIIGPVTLRAINNTDRDAFVYQFLLENIDLYTYIISKDASQKRFILGWLRRTMKIYEEYNRHKH